MSSGYAQGPARHTVPSTSKGGRSEHQYGRAATFTEDQTSSGSVQHMYPNAPHKSEPGLRTSSRVVLLARSVTDDHLAALAVNVL